MSVSSYNEKYRVISAAFWNAQSNFNLNLSDKIVLPQSVLGKLNPVDVPVTLKVMNANNNQKYRYCNAVDFSAPEGLTYMSSWLIKELGLDPDISKLNEQNNTTIVVSKIDPNEDGKTYCKAEYIQFQPLNTEFVYFEDSSDFVKKTLINYYSCLKLGDIVNVKYKNLRNYPLKVTNMLGTNETIAQYYLIHPKILVDFVDPPDFLKNDNNNVHSNNKNKNDESKNDDNNKKEEVNNAEDIEWDLDPTFDWEIVNVEKYVPPSPLKKEEPKRDSDDNVNSYDGDNGDNDHNDDNEVPNNNNDNNNNDNNNNGNNNNDNNNVNDMPVDNNENNVNNILVNNDDNNNNDNDKDVNHEDKVDDIKNNQNENGDNNDKDNDLEDLFEWVCPKCTASNELKYNFCPQCGCQQSSRAASVSKDDEHKKPEPGPNNNNEVMLFKTESLIHKDIKYEPGESRQTGFILKNITQPRKLIKMKAKLERIDKNEIDIEYDSIIDIDSDQSLYIVLEIKAPHVTGKFTSFFQLVSLETNKRICDLLQLNTNIVSPYTQEEENKINNIAIMGFKNRKKVIDALKKWKWDVEKAVNWLVTH